MHLAHINSVSSPRPFEEGLEDYNIIHSKLLQQLRPSSVLYHARSIWLFTRSDLKTIVVPQTLFGIIAALVLSSAGITQRSWVEILLALPRVGFFVWINLLPFAIDNQRQPDAILEDRHNKPWRTMPSGRMSGAQAKALMFVLYPAAFLVSRWLGGTRQCLALMLLGYAYNDLNLADLSWVTRNGINGLGFCCFASGALEVAIEAPLSGEHHRVIVRWLCMIAAIVFSTVQSQDMADQEGDSLRGRKSMPLEIGDGLARWLTAVPMVVWSAACPLYWQAGVTSSVVVGGLGLGIAYRTLAYRSVPADKSTFRMWNAWMACLYMLPLAATVL